MVTIREPSEQTPGIWVGYLAGDPSEPVELQYWLGDDQCSLLIEDGEDLETLLDYQTEYLVLETDDGRVVEIRSPTLKSGKHSMRIPEDLMSEIIEAVTRLWAQKEYREGESTV